MQNQTNGKKKPRIAWGGDRYFISDGLPTEYFINLQKEKVMREKNHLNPSPKEGADKKNKDMDQHTYTVRRKTQTGILQEKPVLLSMPVKMGRVKTASFKVVKPPGNAKKNPVIRMPGAPQPPPVAKKAKKVKRKDPIARVNSSKRQWRTI